MPSEPRRKPPKYIYLQWYGADKRDPDYDGNPVPRDCDVFWCEDRIYDTDAKYVLVTRKRRKKDAE